eukprot:3742058-Heterocapsa_arctica.AAC.1
MGSGDCTGNRTRASANVPPCLVTRRQQNFIPFYPGRAPPFISYDKEVPPGLVSCSFLLKEWLGCVLGR